MINLNSPEGASGTTYFDADLENHVNDASHESKRRVCWLTTFDYLFIGIPTLMVFPLYRLAHLPIKIDLFSITTGYWGATTVSAAFFSIIYALVVFPIDLTFMPFLRRIKAQKGRIAIILMLALLMIYALGPGLGAMVTVGALGVGELLERRGPDFKAAIISIFFPALLLFFGLILVFTINHAQAALVYAPTNDALFSNLDRLIFHANVASISIWTLHHVSPGFSRFLEFVYYGMFGQLTAALVFTALRGNQEYAVKYVRTILVCYAIALTVFALCPVKGPYSIGMLHLTSYPRSLATFWSQETFLTRAQALFAHNLTPDITKVGFNDYFVGFPSLHTALPIIAIWFLRPWKRLARIQLWMYLTLLLPSVVLLGWHFLMDLAGGVATAFLSIWITELISRAIVAHDSMDKDPTQRFAFPDRSAPLAQTE
ncbi:MAG: phosphatase PAP2 family protein [Terracidiphilus sp.]